MQHATWRRASALLNWQVGVRIGVGLLVATVAASWAILAVAHLNDRYQLDPVAGNWLGLAHYATHGILFPPVYEDGYYGGTRYMPLPVLADAGIARLTGELLLSAKLVTYLVALIVFAMAFVALRQVGCPRLHSSLLLACVLVTSVGLLGTLGLRNDGLAIALQLAAVTLTLRGRTAFLISSAGVASALAIFSKVSAVWAATAIALWLLANHRARLATFLVAFGVSIGLSTVLFELVTGGRFASQVAEFTFAGRSGPPVPLIDGVQALVTDFVASADAVWLLFPLAVAAIATTLRWSGPTLLQIALLADLAILSVIMSSPETSENHLLDLCVLTALVVGEFVGSRAGNVRGDIAPLVVAVAAVWGVISSYQRTMGPEAVGALRQLRHESAANPAYERNPLEGFVTRKDRILAQDPSIPLAVGQRPILLDGFITRHAVADDPQLEEALVRRIERREFDKIILVAPLEPEVPGLYPLQFLGRTVNDAVLANYRIAYVERDVYVYLPVRGS